MSSQPAYRQPTPPTSPKRTNTHKYKDAEGNYVEEAKDHGNTEIRTHYDWDANTNDQQSKIRVTKNKDGDYEQHHDGDEPPAIRAHYDWDANSNEHKSNNNIRVSKNKDGDYEQHHDGDEPPAIRTHDYSNEKEINEKLFGANAPKPPSRTSTGHY